MQLFYNPNINETTERLFVTNGLGFLFKTEIVLGSDIKCTVKIVSIEKSEQPKYHLHLAVAHTKMNDRYEWFLEKATEMGISEITPIICDHSERKFVKSDRFDKILQSAMKQSVQFYLPKLNEPITFKEFIKQKNEGLLLIAHCEETAKKSLKSVVKPNESVTLLIGPEGDFSNKEIAQALENKYTPVTLGATRLRTETAAIVACHSIVFINEITLAPEGGIKSNA